MAKYEYVPQGVCSRKIIIEVEEDTIKDITFVGGCPGNTLGISSLVRGMKVRDVLEKLDGIMCGYKKTSCPNELAKFLKDYQNKK